MLRNLLFYCLGIPLSIYWSLRMLRLDPAASTSEDEDRPGKVWARALVRLLGLRIEADLSALTPGGRYVFFCNHQSNIDIPILYTALDGYSIRFVAKKSLFEIPVFGKAMHRAGHICIDRGNRRQAMKSLAAAVDVIQGGIDAVVFPEGTRNPDLDGMLEFKTGGAILALKAGLPVVPLVMCCTGELLPKGRLWFRPVKTIRIRALVPIEPGEFDLKEREAFTRAMRERMLEAYTEMRREAA